MLHVIVWSIIGGLDGGGGVPEFGIQYKMSCLFVIR